MSSLVQDVWPFATGLIFGFALDRGRVSVPYTITTQMKFQNFTMMRMFLGASAMSTFCIFLFHLLGVKERVPKDRVSLGLGMFYGFGANIVGGLLLGAGMALAGACPGTVWPQVIAFRSAQQAAVIAGGIFGTILFGYFERVMKERNPNFQKARPDPLADKPNFLALLSVAFIGMLGAVIAGFDYLFPWQQEMSKILGEGVKVESFGPTSWDPLYAGIVVGFLQASPIITHGQYFGQSSGWVYMADKVASLFDSDLEKNAPYLRKARYSDKCYWQFISALGAIIGAGLSQVLLPSPLSAAAAQTLSLPRAFLGGCVMLIGARLGGGCTSGHGLSGVATMSMGSMLSVASMFIGGGIASIIVEPLLVTNLL